MSHFLELVIEGGEPRIKFRCNGTADASCRRRPPDWRDRESWTAEEATQGGFACRAFEWVEAAGIEDAIFGDDRVLSSVEVDICYDEGVAVYPIRAEFDRWLQKIESKAVNTFLSSDEWKENLRVLSERIWDEGNSTPGYSELDARRGSEVPRNPYRKETE